MTMANCWVKSSPHRSLDIAEIPSAGWQRQACRRLRRTGGEPGPFSAGSGGGNGIVVGRQSRRCSNWVQRNINGMSDCNPEVRLPCSATEQFRTCVPPPDRTSNQGERSIEEDLPPDSVARLRKIFEGEIIAAGGFAVAQRRWWKRATLTWSYFWSPAECI